MAHMAVVTAEHGRWQRAKPLLSVKKMAEWTRGYLLGAQRTMSPNPALGPCVFAVNVLHAARVSSRRGRAMAEQKIVFICDRASRLMNGDSDPRYDVLAGHSPPTGIVYSGPNKNVDTQENQAALAEFRERTWIAQSVLPRLLADGWQVKSVHIVSDNRRRSDSSYTEEGGVVGYVLLERDRP